MQLGKSTGADKQNPVLIIVLIVVILGAVFLFARNFIGGSGGGSEQTAPGPAVGGDSHGSMPFGPPSGQPVPPPGGTPAGAPQPAAPAPSGSAAPQAPSQPAPPAAPAPAPNPGQPASESKLTGSTRTTKVFGKVNVTHPADWKLDISVADSAAVFTNGRAVFEVHAPDPKADSAKAIAQSALAKLSKSGAVSASGETKVGGYDAYYYAANVGGRTARIVGVDAPTRVVLLAYVKSGSFADYRGTFDKIQSSIRFD